MWLSNSVVVLRVSRWSIDKFAKTLALGNYRLDADLLSKKRALWVCWWRSPNLRDRFVSRTPLNGGYGLAKSGVKAAQSIFHTTTQLAYLFAQRYHRSFRFPTWNSG